MNEKCKSTSLSAILMKTTVTGNMDWREIRYNNSAWKRWTHWL